MAPGRRRARHHSGRRSGGAHGKPSWPAPAALFGLIALFFAEETLDVRQSEIVREISIFGRGERRLFPSPAETRLLWTNRPVPPWWTLDVPPAGHRDGNEPARRRSDAGEYRKTALAALLTRLIE